MKLVDNRLSFSREEIGEMYDTYMNAVDYVRQSGEDDSAAILYGIMCVADYVARTVEK
jgi:hypothetical protein